MKIAKISNKGRRENKMKTKRNVENYYFAGEYTTTTDDNGFVLNRTCGHKHSRADLAESCAAKTYTHIVYLFANGRTLRAVEDH